MKFDADIVKLLKAIDKKLERLIEYEEDTKQRADIEDEMM